MTPQINISNHPVSTLKSLKGMGWHVNKTKSNHWRAVAPSGALVFMGSTPSDWRARLNVAARISRILKSKGAISE